MNYSAVNLMKTQSIILLIPLNVLYPYKSLFLLIIAQFYTIEIIKAKNIRDQQKAMHKNTQGILGQKTEDAFSE